ncbi:metallophosphoesterase family protein [Companilactobacillus metriopterae]|uniref:metallophosphoesterase family protein n=1 Tax=Companilactobacillus metriopterae TaxID=1909267 RepID=UPI00100B4D84|nr:metallophosphoesterase [Companilactobacillus metriopterae]
MKLNVFGKDIFSKNVSTHIEDIFMNIKPRSFATNYIENFYNTNVKEKVSKDSLNLSLLTDTHAKALASTSYYGYNGLRHIYETNAAGENLPIDLNVHLGDLIDGSDRPEISKRLLKKATENYQSSGKPFYIAEGNHDENDKFDEHKFIKSVSFDRDDYFNLVTKQVNKQPEIQRLSHVSKVSWFDKDDIRVIFINTSDIPYIVYGNNKKYDFKKVRGVREQQIQDLIKILENTVDKRVIVMGHANIVSPSGKNALNFNGDLLQKIFEEFNNKQQGQLKNNLLGDFGVSTAYDFSNTGISTISTYICGHMHYEKHYQVSGINHIILNCSALMGKKRGLTTDYNRKWDRKINEISEFCGYFINVDSKKMILQIFGYGAATRYVNFNL